MAVDIPRLYDYLDAEGVKQPMSGPYADSSFWFTKSNYPDYDLEGAKALIDEYAAEIGPVEFDFAGGQANPRIEIEFGTASGANVTEDCLDHDHRGINDDAEVHRAQR